MSWRGTAVGALARAFAAGAAGNEPALAAPHDDVAAFLQEEASGMPAHLRLAAAAGTLAFDLSGLFTEGALFHRLPAARQQARLRAWKESRLGPCRDLMRFYESLSVYALYARLDR